MEITSIPWLLILAIFLLSCRWLDAAGIAMIKEQTFHEDATAKSVVFGTVTDSGASFVVFETAGKKQSIEKSKIAATLQVLDSIPKRISSEDEIAPLRKSLSEMETFKKRFPQVEKIVANHIVALTEHIEKYEGGFLRADGKWITKAEFTALNQEQELKIAALEKQELDRENQKEEYEKGQLAKGLVRFEGQWLAPEELAKIREQRADVLKKLHSVPLPLVVKSKFEMGWPGGGHVRRIINYKIGQRFALLPATAEGKDKFQTLRFEDETPLTHFRDLPSLVEHVEVDLAALKDLPPAAVTWGITLLPITGAEGVKKVSVKNTPSKPAFQNGHSAAIALIIQISTTDPSKARLVSCFNLADPSSPMIEITLKSFDQIKDVMLYGVVLVDGAGNTSAPVFPKESDFPQMAEMTAALSAYGLFKMSQDIVETRIKSLQIGMDANKKQNQALSSAMAAARIRADNAKAKFNGDNLTYVAQARAEYQAALSEERVLKLQSDGLTKSFTELWKQLKETEKELVKIN